MSVRAIAALYTTGDEATQIFDELKAAGFERVEVSALEGKVPGLDAPLDAYDVAREEPPASEAAPFFHKHDSPASSFPSELALLGFTQADARSLFEGLMRGGNLVTVDAAADPRRAREIMTRFDAEVCEATARDDGPANAGSAAVTSGTGGQDTLQLRAEQLEIDKHLVRYGQASVRKETITEMRSIEVPVTREELVIERSPAAAGAASAEPVGAGEEIRIPLSEERVSVEKHAVVTEEVEVGTRRIAETQHVTETVRHEELHIERPDDRP